VGLNPGELYSYDLLITPADSAPARLGDLGLLSDHADAPKWLALGYQDGWLPSFATVPDDVADLKLIQGSCRGSTRGTWGTAPRRRYPSGCTRGSDYAGYGKGHLINSYWRSTSPAGCYARRRATRGCWD